MPALLNEEDCYLFHQGTHYSSYSFLGCHHMTINNEEGLRFTVWAPNASAVGVAGVFNDWNSQHHQLEQLTEQGLWSGFFTNIPHLAPYKYEILHPSGKKILKADPYARQAEVRPATASITPSNSKAYEWKDTEWLKNKKKFSPYDQPISIYEVHLGSWKKHQLKTENEDEILYTYRDFADELIPYVKQMGFTHIELLPILEHPFDLSWGYQITGYYAVTSRFGDPDSFKYFIDQCHQNNIGVILDWVPGHFCKDDHGLRQFDGEPLYEYSDPRKADKVSWGTLTFDFGRPEVQSFLVSNALYWLKEFHLDGLRVDAVASMMYLNFDKTEEEERILNSFGEEYHLEAIAFLKKLNKTVFEFDPQSLMMAEDSSDEPLITAPIHEGGLGFNYKWDLGWMNDSLKYMKLDPLFRKGHHHLLTFSFMYAYSENFVLPLSHDEVVHGKKSLLDKMPGDQWQKFAKLRLLYGYMFSHMGKKLLFMGGELGLYAEWKDKEELDWHLLDYPLHQGIQDYVSALNQLYKSEPALYELDHDPRGLEWIDADNHDQSILIYARKGKKKNEELIIVLNFTPVVLYDFKIGVASPGKYQEIFNSDKAAYGGSGQLNTGDHFTEPEPWHLYSQHMKVMVPPLAISIFKKAELNLELEEDIK